MKIGQFYKRKMTGSLSTTSLIRELRKIHQDLLACDDLDSFNGVLYAGRTVIEQARLDLPEYWYGPVPEEEPGDPWKTSFDKIEQELKNDQY